ncbi:hypothetical protein [Virgibacillus necropolis]|uniref:Uncharacterized protein n=1 Tax=Virgibacillus necropolis TaxID=163877 RepID=A0A221MD71_9BACI|nr:hypothetical protein [Virgibacillus necropolis]ASN05638.1 hypothetical protein CFK40_11760 [Virgibacillus necropolis]
MKKFTSIETSLISKWFDGEIDIILDNAKSDDYIELISILSEKIEKKVMDDPQYISEGYVSEIVHKSLDNVDYRELIDYYKE